MYPNNTNGEIEWSKYATERFCQYASDECDYDVVYQTQDAYSADILPNPHFSKYESYPNAYRVTWHRYEHKEQVSVILVFKEENGRMLIDNVLEKGKLLFDYSKPSVPFYGE